jgi:hypothetical protein
MTGSFARTSPQAAASQPQGWMTAPIFTALMMQHCAW